MSDCGIHIGYDVGGTAIKAGIIADDMQIVCKTSKPFPKSQNYIEAADIMECMAKEMLAQTGKTLQNIASVGIAVAGGIDVSGEKIIDAYNLGFHGVPMKKEMKKRFPGVPVHMANDADAAAVAELFAGAFRGYKNAVLMTLGTGVGGGLIINGRLFTGGIGHGIELGHMCLIFGGEPCTCGNNGCVESYCTATWLKAQGERIVKTGESKLLSDMCGGSSENMNAKMVTDCAKKGDKAAVEVFDTFVKNLSGAIVSVTSILDPEIIAIGGGVSLAGDFLFEPVRKLVKKHSFFKYDYKIVPAELGNDAGIVGAAMLAKNYENKG